MCISFFALASTTANTQEPTNVDSAASNTNVLPPTSKSKQGDNATKYSTPPKSKSDWTKKIYLGGYFGLSFGSYTNIELSPIVGYNFTKDFSMGIGVIYSYYSYNYNIPGYPDTKISASNWGFRLNANYILLNLVRLGAEYQYLNVDYWDRVSVNPDGTPIYAKKPYNILFLGGGINQRAGRNTSIFIMFYYDVLQNDYYYNNYIFRVGVSAGF